MAVAADGEGAEARFNSPGALVFDPVSKLLYVADTGNHAIRAVEETDSGWRVTTVVGTGAPGGFGGPALEYSGRVTLQRHVNELVDKAKEIAVLTVGQKHMLPPEEQAAFESIIQLAEGGQWKDAQRASIQFAQDQVR